MLHLDLRALLEEWSGSAHSLDQILEEPVRTASVPDGYYSRDVAWAASLGGIQVLFTSEPTIASQAVDGFMVLGRGMYGSTVTARIAAGELRPRCLQGRALTAQKNREDPRAANSI